MSRRLAPAAIPAADAAKMLATNPGLQGWVLQPADATRGADRIHKTYIFQDFHQAFRFMTVCTPFINATDHHPEWFNVYNRVEVTLSTHDANEGKGGLSAKDIALAAEMERVREAVAGKK